MPGPRARARVPRVASPAEGRAKGVAAASPGRGAVDGVAVRAADEGGLELLSRATAVAAPVARRRCWYLHEVVELEPEASKTKRFHILGNHQDGEGSIEAVVRSGGGEGKLAPYVEVLSTVLHELAHFEHAGHGPGFYELLGEIVADVGADIDGAHAFTFSRGVGEWSF